ncbi:MAG: TMEM165/GDT1 family protein [Armatimonadetes bacterium]|nr:TMEM165/GDT1 family protein [Armatimonadota bacterium]
MQAFWLATGIVFIAELGDKTQLVALCLASRFNAKVVLAGIFVATLVVHVVSVLLGGGVGTILPAGWIKLAAGVAFIGFGLWTLRGDTLSDEECQNIQGRSPFWLVVTTFFLAELGDKTMLSTVALATNHSMIPVWIGSTLGMVLSDALAIIVGQILGAKLPERAIRVGAAVIFFGFGAFSSVQGSMVLPTYAWAIGPAVICVLVAVFIRGVRKERKAERLAELAAGDGADMQFITAGER